MLVRESISFQRGIDPKSVLGIGNDFNTLSPGAILRIKRFFGSSISTGIIGGYNSSANRFQKNSYLLVTKIRSEKNKKIIFWVKIGDLEDAKAKREIFRKGGIETLGSMIYFGYKKGFFDMLSKVRFDYRFEIIEKGF